MKMAAYTKLIAKHTISSPNKHGVSMCGIFTYHFKNIDGKNVGKSTVPPTGSTTKIPAKKKKHIPQTTIHHHPFEFARRVYSFIPWRHHTPKDLPLCW